MKKYEITITWMYPDLMSTYGDRGNIIALERRCFWRNIKVHVVPYSIHDNEVILNNTDIFFMGGAQDQQQKIVSSDLMSKKDVLKQKINDGTPGLFICGAYQFLGEYYQSADGIKIPGLQIFPIYTIHNGNQKKRLIGNIVTKWDDHYVIGFENHGGRTYLLNNAHAFANVIYGFGNNGQDKQEGILYKNSIGTYLHGPILPKNPMIADWLIQKALEKKYNEFVQLPNINDQEENSARKYILKRLNLFVY